MDLLEYLISVYEEHEGILNQAGKSGVHNAETGIPDNVWAKQRAKFWMDLARQYGY